MITINPYPISAGSGNKFPFPHYGPNQPNPGTPSGWTLSSSNGRPVGSAVSLDGAYAIMWSASHGPPSVGADSSGLVQLASPIENTGGKTFDCWMVISNATTPLPPGLGLINGSGNVVPDYTPVSTSASTEAGVIAFDSTTNKGVIVGGTQWGHNSTGWSGDGYGNPVCTQINTTPPVYDFPQGGGNIPPAAPGTTTNPLPANPKMFRLTGQNLDTPSGTISMYSALAGATSWTRIVTTPVQPWMTQVTHFGWWYNSWGAPGVNTNYPIIEDDAGWGPGTGRVAPFTY